MTEFEHPERAYRRGFTQGCSALLEAVKAELPESRRLALRQWINGELTRWRVAAPHKPLLAKNDSGPRRSRRLASIST
jgi:hypothetical protein